MYEDIDLIKQNTWLYPEVSFVHPSTHFFVNLTKNWISKDLSGNHSEKSLPVHRIRCSIRCHRHEHSRSSSVEVLKRVWGNTCVTVWGNTYDNVWGSSCDSVYVGKLLLPPTRHQRDLRVCHTWPYSICCGFTSFLTPSTYIYIHVYIYICILL